MAEADVLIHTFLDGETMMLRVIWHGQVLQFALSLAEITNMTATIADWQRVTMQAIAAAWAPEQGEQIVAAINARERASLEALRSEAALAEAEHVAFARAERQAEQRAHDQAVARQRREEDSDAPPPP
jgi:hypothetical protein